MEMSRWIVDATGRVCPDCASLDLRYMIDDEDSESETRDYVCDNCSCSWTMYGPREEI